MKAIGCQNVTCSPPFMVHYTNKPCQCGYPDEMSPRGRMDFPRSRGPSPRENHPPEGRHSIRIPTLAWHTCFIIPNKPQFGKISMKITMTAGRSSENGGRFAGGHFASGQDGMANLSNPIMAYDFHVRYNNMICHVTMMEQNVIRSSIMNNLVATSLVLDFGQYSHHNLTLGTCMKNYNSDLQGLTLPLYSNLILIVTQNSHLESRITSSASVSLQCCYLFYAIYCVPCVKCWEL